MWTKLATNEFESSAMAALRVADFFARHHSESPVLLDYEEAYDRVGHDWVDTCLAQSGLCTNLRQVLMALLQGMRSRLIINGGLED